MIEPCGVGHHMRKFHSIAALCGDGLRPELQALFDRLAVDPHSELFVRHGGMTQSGPDPISKGIRTVPARPNWPNSPGKWPFRPISERGAGTFSDQGG
jgi:hypothetical protein